MADVHVLSSPPSAADLVRQLSTVADQFGFLLNELRLHTDQGGETPEQAALHRLITGEVATDEAVAAGLSFSGARLIVATLLDSQAGLRILEQLRPDRSLVAVWQPPAQLVILVRGVPQRAGDDRGLRTTTRVAALILRTAPTTAVGVSSSLSSPDQASGAHTEALDAAFLAEQDADRLVFADQRWAHIAARRLARHAARALPLENAIARVREYDARHGAELARTVGVWLANNGDTATTATALSLHPNTLRYRLRRVQEVCDLDLDDADVRAVAHLLLRA